MIPVESLGSVPPTKVEDSVLVYCDKTLKFDHIISTDKVGCFYQGATFLVLESRYISIVKSDYIGVPGSTITSTIFRTFFSGSLRRSAAQ